MKGGDGRRAPDRISLSRAVAAGMVSRWPVLPRKFLCERFGQRERALFQ